MKSRENRVFEFGLFRLNTAEGVLSREGQSIPLTPKAFEILVVLVRNAGHLLSKDELMQTVWPDIFVEEGNLKVNISALRKALGDTSDEPAFIETIPRRGYRFLAKVSMLEAPDTAILVDKPGQVVLEKRTLTRTITEEEEEIGDAPLSSAQEELASPSVPPLPAPGRQSPVRRVWFLAFAALVVSLCAAGLYRYLGGRPGTPVRVTLAGRKLQAWDGKESLAWEYEFKEPMAWTTTAGREGVTFADLAGDGHSVILAPLIYAATAVGPAMPHGTLFCFSTTGHLLWAYDPDVKLRFDKQEYTGPWSLAALTLVREGNRQSIWVAFDHPIWWPSFVVRIGPSGAADLRFVNSGRTWFLKELRRSDGSFLLAAGTNNEFKQASVAVLDVSEPFSISPQSQGGGYLCANCGLHFVPYYLLFPRSEIYEMQNVPFHLVQTLDVSGDGFTVWTYEGADKTIQMADIDLLAFYQVSADLQKVSGALGDTYWRLHRRLEQEGKIHHRAQDCPDQRIAERIRIFTRQNGWWNPAEAHDKTGPKVGK